MRYVWILCIGLVACTPTEKKVETSSGSSLKMQVKTKGEGFPLVLVPGGLTGWVSWDPFVDHFAGSHKVIQVQLLSVQYGLENRKLPEGYSIRKESAALAATLDSVSLNVKADFIGWSFGGLVLLDYVLSHPEKINTLTLIEPPALWLLKNEGRVDEGTQQMLEFLSTFPADKNNVTEDELEKFLEFVGFTKPGQSAKELPQWNMWVSFRQSLRSNQAVYDHTDQTQRLNVISRPVLLVKGTGSASFLHQIIDALGEKLPASKIVEYPGGHAPHLVSRNEFLMAADSLIGSNRQE